MVVGMGRQRHKTMSDQLRAIIRASGMTRYAICKEIGLDQATMSRFMSGDGGLSMDTLDALSKLLKLGVTSKGKGRQKGR